MTDSSKSDSKAKAEGLAVYPSLHYLMSKTQRGRKPLTPDFDLGDKDLNRLLSYTVQTPRVVTVKGPPGTLKSTFGANFLVSGLTRPKKEDPRGVLFVRLWDDIGFDPKTCTFSEHMPYKLSLNQFERDDRLSAAAGPPRKASIAKWRYKKTGRTLTELAFKTGSILPEEFMHEVLLQTGFEATGGKGLVSKVVLDDVSQIGTSYPLLRQSKIAGDLCLPAFVHLLRSEGIDVLLVGSVSELPQANEVVNTACSLSDFVITSDFCDVFGEKHIIVQGQATTATLSETETPSELVPGVVRTMTYKTGEDKRTTFHIDTTLLSGLVGFDTGHISRPGLTFYTFEEAGNVHQDYNRQVDNVLSFAFGRPFARDGEQLGGGGSNADVRVEPFSSLQSAEFHEALFFPHNSPIDRTTLCTIDEFSSRGHRNEPGLVALPDVALDSSDASGGYLPVFHGIEKNMRPYYANVLLLAFPWKGTDDELKTFLEPYTTETGRRFKDWRSVEQAATGIAAKYPKDGSRLFDYDWTVPETNACALMDAIVSAVKQEQPMRSLTSPLLALGPDLQAVDEARGEEIRELLTSVWNDDHWVPLMAEIAALRRLLKASIPEPKTATGNEPSGDDRKASRPKTDCFHDDSSMYLCWYSQLRNLISEHPVLSGDLRVCALPGRGFRGDWFAGIVRGSVSLTLGKEVLDILCGKTEEYKRFIQGVGLPTRKSFCPTPGQDQNDPKFFAWPGSHVDLRNVLEFHADALSRRQIGGYRSFRLALHTVCEQIIAADDDENRIWEMVSRLGSQIRFLSPNAGADKAG